MAVEEVRPFSFTSEQIKDAEQSLKNLRILRLELDKAVRSGIDMQEQIDENSRLQKQYVDFLGVYRGN